MTHNEKSIPYRLVALTILMACVGAGYALNGQLAALAPGKSLSDEQIESSFHWNPTFFRMLTFGHLPAAVDWLLIRFLSDSNMKKVVGDQETTAYRILDLATEFDPAYFPFYTMGGNYLAIIRGDRNGALSLVQKGERFRREELPHYTYAFRAEYWENPWRVPMILGYIQLLEFQNVQAARSAYHEITKIPNVPIYIRRLALGMESARGRIRVARNSVEVIEKWYEDDPVMLAPVIRARKLLDLAAFLYDANALYAREIKGSKKKSLGAFLGELGIPPRDEFGGAFFLTPDGRIDTPTSREAVFGTTVDLLVRSSDNG